MVQLNQTLLAAVLVVPIVALALPKPVDGNAPSRASLLFWMQN